MPRRKTDEELLALVGTKYGRLTIVEKPEYRPYGDGRFCKPFAKVHCDCGNETTIELMGLLRTEGPSQSCGCINKKYDYEALIGKTFNRLTILSTPVRNKTDKSVKTYVDCLCTCGVQKSIDFHTVMLGTTQSCGCLQKEIAAEIGKKSSKEVAAAIGKLNTKHGNCRRSGQTREYNSWLNMKQRCYNAANNRYYSHGGRGITVCSRWKDSFENFLEDMGPAPSKSHTVDRINNDGNYEPGNCRWATPSEQARNRRSSIPLEVAKEVRSLKSNSDLSVKQIAAQLGVKINTVRRVLEDFEYYDQLFKTV